MPQGITCGQAVGARQMYCDRYDCRGRSQGYGYQRWHTAYMVALPACIAGGSVPWSRCPAPTPAYPALVVGVNNLIYIFAALGHLCMSCSHRSRSVERVGKCYLMELWSRCVQDVGRFPVHRLCIACQ